jgi:ferritin-like metal-binding protein YciE
MATAQKRKSGASKKGSSSKRSGTGKRSTQTAARSNSPSAARSKARTKSIAKSRGLGEEVLDSVQHIFAPNGKEKTIQDLFKDAIKDMYSAENQLVEALPKMAEAAESSELKKAFKKHLAQTKRQAERLETIMKQMKTEPGSKECKAMKGLVEEGEEIIKHFEEGPVRDAGLIMAAQKVEHYEIASYGTLCEMAERLGLDKINSSLGIILQEEKDTDETLTEIAIEVNEEAIMN